MDDAERRVAVLHAARDDAERDEVVDLLELDLLPFQLEPDAVQTLDSAVDANHRHLRVAELRGDLGGQPLDDAGGGLALGLDARAKRLVGHRLEVLEGELLELVLDLGHAEAVGDRRVDVERLLRCPDAAVVRHVLQRPHVVEPIGELDEDDADVVDHRQQHLAEVLDLPLLARREGDRADLRDPFDDVGDIVSECLRNPLDGGQGVFDDVVEEPGGDADDIELHVGEDVRNLERVDEVGLARVADLSLVLEGREHIGPPEQFEVGVRTVGPDLVEKVLEANHENWCLTLWAEKA